MQAAPDAELAGRVIEELRRTCEFCPSDATIFKVATALQPPPPVKASWPPAWEGYPICPLGECDGSGYVPVGDGVTKCRCFGKPRKFAQPPPIKSDEPLRELVREAAAAVALPVEPAPPPTQHISREEVESARTAELERRRGAR